MMSKQLDLEYMLDKAEQGTLLTDRELKFILGLREPLKLQKLFRTARKLRERYFGCKVFLYGFIYFSTYCRNDCSFCRYRRSNHSFTRYRKNDSEILSIAQVLAEKGVHLLDLTMGEDPRYHTSSGEGFERLFGTIDRVKRATGLPLMISPGVVPEEALREFKKAGVDWYACYQETHNKTLYEQLRVEQSYDERMAAKAAARRWGLLIEEGLLTGIGDSDKDVVASLRVMRLLGADQARVMTFVSQPGTPLAGLPTVSRIRELVIIALLRLTFPERLIPASLDVDGIMGLSERLQAGANVVTSIIPSQAGLAGVSQSSLDIEEGCRSVGAVSGVLTQLGLQVADASEYAGWVEKRQNIGNGLGCKGVGKCGSLLSVEGFRGRKLLT